MALRKPYAQTVRQLVDGSYENGGNGRYVKHCQYSASGQSFVRTFLLLQKDLLEIFEYIEPSASNMNTYSLRNFALLLRLCTEIETNYKEILRANVFTPQDWARLTMDDYRLINKSHFLSGYKARLPHLDTGVRTRQPFKAWEEGRSLDWYKAYNDVKHNRSEMLSQASLNSVVDAFCALAILIAAQYLGEDFSHVDYLVAENSDADNFESMQDGYTLVKFPNIPETERYEFDWHELSQRKNPVQKFNYDDLKS